MTLISREAALDAIDKNRQDLLSLGMNGAEHILVHYGRRVIEELPTAEVTLCHLDSPCEYQNADIAMPTAERVGKWIKDKERSKGHIVPIFGCSNCNEMEAWGWDEVKVYRYCPNCGARMEGEEG